MYLERYQDQHWDMLDFSIDENKWGLPVIENRGHFEVNRLIAFNNKKEHQGWCHFFLYDYMFRSLWNTPTKYISKLKQFKGILVPDFSTYVDYPLALNIYNVYRNRWLGKYYQEHGINVIPTLVWGEYNSFDFAFKGIEKGSQVSVTTMGNRKDKHLQKLFLDGIEQLIKEIEPYQIILYGKMPKELENEPLIKLFDPYYNGYSQN